MVVVVGISHQASALSVRERAAIQGDCLSQAYQHIMSSGLVTEVIWWVTCGRTECIAQGKPEALKQWFIEYFQLQDEPEGSIYTLTDRAAYTHWLKVACGLDSRIVGEPQILGQLKRAFEAAQQQQTLGEHLRFWTPIIIREAKRIRAHTGLTAARTSLPNIIKTVAGRIFESVYTLRWLVVGTGELAKQQLSFLKTLGVHSIHLVGRHREKTRDLAQAFGAQWSVMSTLPQVLAETDVWVMTTSSTLPFISRGLVERAQKSRHHRALLVADLAVPRDVETDASSVQQVYVYTLEDLTALIAAQQHIQQSVLTAAHQQIQLSIEEHEQLYRVRGVQSVLVDFRETVDCWRDEVACWGQKQLEKGVDAETVLIQGLRRLSRHMVHGPTRVLKQAARRQQTDLIDCMRMFLSAIRPKRQQKERTHADHRIH